MNYKAIFFDIDGTLMNSKTGIIPSSTIDALNKLKENNIKIFVATSRCKGEYGNFSKYLDKIQFDGIISCAGGNISINDEVITSFIDENDTNKIIEYCLDHNIELRYQGDDKCHLLTTPSQTVYDSFIYFYNYCPSTKPYENEPIINFLCFGTKEDYEAIRKMCNALDGTLYDDCFELTKQGVNKAYGIKKVCEYLNISPSDTIAFGDAENDINMLETVGLGIAMGNACDVCKEASDFITKRIDEDGIAYALEKFDVINDLHLSKNEYSLTQARKKDIPHLLAWWNDGKVMAHAGFPNGLNKTYDDVLKEIKSNTKNKRRLIIRYSSKEIGEMAYSKVDDGIYEIGIKICDETYQNKHLGPTYLQMLIEYLFEELNANKIILDTDLENKRAQKVYERLGFTNKKVHLNSWTNQLNEIRSSVSYSLSRNDFKKRIINK